MEGKYSVTGNWRFYSDLSFLEFLQNLGRHFRISNMLRRENVRSRLDSETGLSLSEFLYGTMQAYDFYRLYTESDCCLQIGGSDQWGNIHAGMDLVQRLVAERGTKGW